MLHTSVNVHRDTAFLFRESPFNVDVSKIEHTKGPPSETPRNYDITHVYLG